MTYKVISFDLQGTLSDAAFSDEFWLELLPELHAAKYSMSLEEAKQEREQDFRKNGRYHPNYYCHKTALAELWPEWTFPDVVAKLNNAPLFYADTLPLLEKLSITDVPVIILSATTRDFIDAELGRHAGLFQHVFSALDDFNTPGKPPEIYHQIADKLGVKPHEILHIGDCKEMDIANAKEAGVTTFFWDKKKNRIALLEELKSVLGEVYA